MSMIVEAQSCQPRVDTLAEILCEDKPQQEPSSQPAATPELPSPWSSWEQVRKVRDLHFGSAATHSPPAPP
jgi:hypothetical protein